MKLLKDKNFSDLNPVFWNISTHKERIKRDLKDLLSKEHFTKTIQEKGLPNLVYEYNSVLRKTGKGIDPVTQENKVVNIKIASSKISGIIIKPGEIFSFWKLVGKVDKKRGYKAGRILFQDKLIPGTGGGLCNLANTINNLVLHSPLKIIEFHSHSDALASDIGHRVPMANGTSVSYNYVDFRFKNDTDQCFQIILTSDDKDLHAELRSEKEIPYIYELVEENHHFVKEEDKYYRISKIYKTTIDKKSNKVVNKELFLDNHSLVMFDPSLIPEDELIC